MTILDDDEFLKRPQDGHNKYLSMAEEGVDYLDIRKEVEKDGLPAWQIPMVMEKVDEIIFKNTQKKSNQFDDHLQLIVGGFFLLLGIGFLCKFYLDGDFLHVFPYIIILIGIRSLSKGWKTIKEVNKKN